MVDATRLGHKNCSCNNNNKEQDTTTLSERKMILRPSLTLSARRNMVDKRQELGGRQTLFNFPLTPQRVSAFVYFYGLLFN